MNNMGRPQTRGPFSRPPGFPNGGGRNIGSVNDAQFNNSPRQTPQLPGSGGGQQTPPLGNTGSYGSFNAASMPWLQAWQGPFAAPMSPWESQGLEGISNFADNDFGLGDASDYLHQVFGGDFLNGNDPNFQAIQDSGEILKQMEDDRVLKELQSRAAAGGNALSGALLGQESDYMRGSNAQFQNMMAQLRAANYGRERGFQQDAVRGALGLSDARLGGYGALMGAGAVPRDIANQEIAGQYGDFLRQGQDFEDAFHYPDNLMLQIMGHGYPGSHPELFGDSDATQLSNWLQQLFGGGGSGLTDFLGGLLNSGSDQPSGDGIGYDGEPALTSITPPLPMPPEPQGVPDRRVAPMRGPSMLNGMTGNDPKAAFRPSAGHWDANKNWVSHHNDQAIYDYDARLAATNPGHMDPNGNRVVNAAGAGHGAPVSVVSPTGQVSGFTGGGIVNGRPGSAPISQPGGTSAPGGLNAPNRSRQLGPHLSYDGEPSGPSSYRDADFYNASLTEAQRANAERLANPGKASGSGKAMMILALLAQVLGLGGGSRNGSKSKGGGGGSSLGQDLGKAAGRGLDSLFNKNPYKKQGGDPKLASAWDKYFKPSGKPRSEAQPEGYKNDLSDIQKIGSSADDPSSSYYNDPLFDPNNFANGSSFDDPSSPYYGDPLFNPDNFAGGGSFDDPGSPYFGDPLFDPSNFADGGGSGIDFGDGGWDPGSVEYYD